MENESSTTLHQRFGWKTQAVRFTEPIRTTHSAYTNAFQRDTHQNWISPPKVDKISQWSISLSACALLPDLETKLIYWLFNEVFNHMSRSQRQHSLEIHQSFLSEHDLKSLILKSCTLLIYELNIKYRRMAE